MIKQFLSREPEFQDIWEQLQKRDDFKQLFEPSTYFSQWSPELADDLVTSGYSPEQQLEYYLQKLKEITQYKIAHPNLEEPRYIDKRIMKYTEKIVALRGDKNINYSALTSQQTSGFLDEWVGNMYDSTDPYIQLAVGFYEERKRRAELRYDREYKGFLARMTPVYQSYQRRNKMAVLDKIPVFKGKLNFTNYADLYSPLYKEFKDGDIIKREWNTTDTDWETARKAHGLSQKEIEEYKRLAEYMQDRYAQFFVNSKSQYKDPKGKAVAL